jgi:hypothetical protein
MIGKKFSYAAEVKVIGSPRRVWMLNAFIGVFGTGGWWGRIDTSSSVPEIFSVQFFSLA